MVMHEYVLDHICGSTPASAKDLKSHPPCFADIISSMKTAHKAKIHKKKP
jgi:hypothetical protein